MRFLAIICIVYWLAQLGYAITRRYPKYDSEEIIENEFSNVAQNAQDKQFVIVNSTPVLSDMREGEFFVYSTGTVSPVLFLRIGTTYFIFRGERYYGR